MGLFLIEDIYRTIRWYFSFQHFWNRSWESWNQIFQNWSYLCTYIGIKIGKSTKSPAFPICGVLKNKSNEWKNDFVFNILWFSTDPGSPKINFFRTGLIYAHVLRYNCKNQENVQFFWQFLVPKKVIWKNHLQGGPEIDCFEPIFGFFMTFGF